MEKEYSFTVEDLETRLKSLVKKGVTEITLHDASLARDKKRILQVMRTINRDAHGLFCSILAEPFVIDREIARCAAQGFFSLEIPLACSQKGDKLLFDKKLYSAKARLLNEEGVVFGVSLLYAQKENHSDSLKQFLERLDFAVQQYPNHLDFPQTQAESDGQAFEATVTGLFSARDIRYARDVAFSARTFYSSGRAVPWFLSVLKPLRIYPSRFFADFAEWQRCNNCDFKSGFLPESESHKSIEKMQLLFLEQKYEEKGCQALFPVAQDIVRLNGALSRLAGEGEEAVVETSYHPDDLLGPESADLQSFSENVCMENCRVKVFSDGENPDYVVQ